MRILAHRGYWKTDKEKNSLEAMERAFKMGFGIETDIRDMNGRLVISHNPPNSDVPLFADLLTLYKKYKDNDMNSCFMALNIKADGLCVLFRDIFERMDMGQKDCFFFDMSAPEQYSYIKQGYQIFTRSSEFEKYPLFIEQSVGVWLDQFTDCKHIEMVLPKMIELGKYISVISPELHHRDHTRIWNFLKEYRNSELLSLCTDLPMEAREYFG